MRKSISCFLKRLIDIAGSGVGLVVFSPLLVLIAVLVKIDSPGPAFFRQVRSGLCNAIAMFSYPCQGVLDGCRGGINV